MRLTPYLQLIQVSNGDLSFSQSFKKMIAQRRWQISPLDLRHLTTEGHSSQYFLDPLAFDEVGGCGESVGQIEEFRFFRFF
jgi:hypothetical protein